MEREGAGDILTELEHAAGAANRGRRMLKASAVIAVLLAVAILALSLRSEEPSGTWSALAPGLDLGSFATGRAGPGGDGSVTVLRIAPGSWRMEILCAAADSAGGSLSAKEWCRREGLVAATNAGMFATDHRTHIGYLKSDAHVNSARLNAYQSVAVFSPSRPGLPLFRIIDLDASPAPIDSLRRGYTQIVQNLRLVKRPRENRWEEKDERWSEAALGEDGAGRALFIFSRTAYSMREFNEVLMKLPIDLVCAQHLEGGPEAQLYVNAGGLELELVGGFETSFDESGTNRTAWPVPNVIGISRP